jgi:excisionase family DNA binding protein
MSKPSLAEPPPRLTYPIEEAAQLLACSKATIYNLIARGELRPINVVPGRTSIPREQIEQLLQRAQANGWRANKTNVIKKRERQKAAAVEKAHDEAA